MCENTKRIIAGKMRILASFDDPVGDGLDPSIFCLADAYKAIPELPTAIRCHVDYLDTIAGIKINERMEVLDKQGNSIPGLYAAGIDTGGWVGDTYCIKTTGTTFVFAINSGRIAGENAAEKKTE